MTARPKIKKVVNTIPIHTYFKPQGISMDKLNVVSLTLEEVEALKLKDVENYDQEDAAKKMGVSRSTFQRVVKNARKKIVSSVIEGSALKIEGGDFIPGENIIIRKCLHGKHHYFINSSKLDSKTHKGKISSIKCPECGERLIDFEK